MNILVINCGISSDHALKIIVCHLGNGASVSAVQNGRCVDTSMGLTPFEGLIMGTRSGDIDPAIMEFISHKENKTIDEVMGVLNKKSGVLGLSGNFSSDFRDADSGTKVLVIPINEELVIARETYALVRQRDC